MRLKFLVLILALGFVVLGVGEGKAMEIPRDPLNFTEIQLHFADDAFFRRHIVRHGLGIGADIPKRVTAFLNLASLLGPDVNFLEIFDFLGRWRRDLRRPWHDPMGGSRAPREEESFALRYLRDFDTFNIYERAPIFIARDHSIVHRGPGFFGLYRSRMDGPAHSVVAYNIPKYQRVGVRHFAITAVEQANDIRQQVVIVQYIKETNATTEGVSIIRYSEPPARVSDDLEWGRVASNVSFNEFSMDDLMYYVFPRMLEEQFYLTPEPETEPSTPAAGPTVPVQTTPSWIRRDFEVDFDIAAAREGAIESISRFNVTSDTMNRFISAVNVNLDEFERNPNSLISTYISSERGNVVLFLIPQNGRWMGLALTYPRFEYILHEIVEANGLVNMGDSRPNIYEFITYWD